ncbi:hypothetical protein JQN58_05260 [Aneurinibacillus sp. BA2021]|nr:hypothetical protein [Aneurinibacillus sp. BA2021]
METRSEVLEAKIEALRKDVERLEKQFNEELGRVEKRFTEDIIRTEKQIYEGMKRLEQRMGAMEQKHDASSAEGARQFTESNKQMIEMQTRVKALDEKLVTSHAQNFSLLQDVNKQLAAHGEWMRGFIDADKAGEEQTKGRMLGWIGAIGTAVSGAVLAFWAWWSKTH